MTSHSNQLVWDNLLSWQKEIKEKDCLLNKRKPLRVQVLSPIRKPVDCVFDKKNQLGLNHLKVKSVPKTNTTTSPPKVGQTKIQEKALVAKEKGNAFFQKQEYQQAIRSYSEAIDLDPTNAIYFVNRAMAYLKIQNYLQAEQDCTKCLNLQPNHVKALWRRGIALRSLGRSNEARNDFEHALQIEPGNKHISQELDKLAPASKATEKEKEQPKKDNSLRQLEINVIDEAYTPETASITKDSSPRATLEKSKSKSETVTVTASPPKINPATTSSVPKTSTTVNPSKPQQQQKPSGTAYTTSASSSPSPSIPSAGSTTLAPLKLTCPRTNYEFERDWKACKRRGDDVIYQYLQCIPPSSYASLFKSSLEPDQFEKMIDIMDRYYTKDKTNDEMFEILQGLGQVKRLDMLVMFLEKKYQQALQRIFFKLNGEIPKPTLSPLARKFSVLLPQ